MDGVTGSTSIDVWPSFSTRAYAQGRFLCVENAVGTDVVRVGMDATLGGAVAEFSLNGSDVVAKSSNGSHLIAVGLYDGNEQYDACNGCTGASAGTFGWNPTESCDYYRHGSPTLDQSAIGDTVYVKSNALEWVPDDKDGGPSQPVLSDIIIERWVSPVADRPHVFRERYRLIHTGTDRHAIQSNAVPSFEINATFRDFVFFSGPNTGLAGPPTNISSSQLPQWLVRVSVSGSSWRQVSSKVRGRVRPSNRTFRQYSTSSSRVPGEPSAGVF